MWTRTQRWVSFLRLCPSILASSRRRGLACLVILACGTRGPLAPTPPGYSCLKMPANKVFVSRSNWILVHADDSIQTPDRPPTTKTLTFLPLVFSDNPNSHATLPSAVPKSNNPNSQAPLSVSIRDTSVKYDFFEYYQPLHFLKLLIAFLQFLKQVQACFTDFSWNPNPNLTPFSSRSYKNLTRKENWLKSTNSHI